MIKMLALADRKREFNAVIDSLNIVPVTLSYEFDPCDQLKAAELHSIATLGRFDKPAGQDLLSLAKGLGGFKGRVKLKFGEPIKGHFDSADAVASELDRRILSNLDLYPVNFAALRALAQAGKVDGYVTAWEKIAASVGEIDVSDFDQRFCACEIEHRDYWLAMYANPIVNKLKHDLLVVKP